jgi:hypothetical protein
VIVLTSYFYGFCIDTPSSLGLMNDDVRPLRGLNPLAGGLYA